ncbi:TetR/AcrR family transcriptional regulator C-terminal domain-containing protein [Streptomyces sp. NPDC052610]|uniref:TetR/AcrR family transcriptional regulator C-terminal domain-containing protein n=1 Tax=Streptomyces sp. NPDC052610 TaxID=3154952 RepID=UPI003440CCDA
MARTRFLTPELITRKALEVGDRGGAESMTMRRIAAELGCDPMALYRHFANRDALLDAVADLAVAEVRDPDPGLPWDERVTATADALREAALSHPGATAHLAARPPMGEHGRRIAGSVLAALQEGGLPPATAVRCFQTLVAYLASSLAMAVRAGERDRRWEQVRDMVNELPAAAAVGEELFTVGSAEQFRFGLRLLMAGIREEAAAHPPGRPSGTTGT